MTKTLTEQWREGKLPNGNYYTICSGWGMETFPCIVYCERNCFDANVIEVLAPVPSYEEYRELLDLNIYEKDRKKVMGLEDKVKHLQELLSQEEDRIRRLLERVGEADKIIKYYAEKHGKLKACDYLNKWGVK